MNLNVSAGTETVFFFFIFSNNDISKLSTKTHFATLIFAYTSKEDAKALFVGRLFCRNFMIHHFHEKGHIIDMSCYNQWECYHSLYLQCDYSKLNKITNERNFKHNVFIWIVANFLINFCKAYLWRVLCLYLYIKFEYYSFHYTLKHQIILDRYSIGILDLGEVLASDNDRVMQPIYHNRKPKTANQPSLSLHRFF